MIGLAMVPALTAGMYAMYNKLYLVPQREFKYERSKQAWYQAQLKREKLEAEYDKELQQHLDEVEAYAKNFAKRFVEVAKRQRIFHKVTDHTREEPMTRIQGIRVKNIFIWPDGFALEIKLPWGINAYRHLAPVDTWNQIRLDMRQPDLKLDIDPYLGIFVIGGVGGRIDGIPKMFEWRSSTTIFTAMQNLPKNSKFNIPIGITHNRYFVYYSLIDDKQPHMLVAGSTHGGKSVFINQMLCTLLTRCTPDDLELYLVDLKGNEFFSYRPLLETGNVSGLMDEPEQAIELLEKLVELMEKRYKAQVKGGCRNLHEWNKKFPDKKEPFVILVIDEFADLSTGKSKKSALELMNILGRKARAAGIHIVIATQRPSGDIVEGSLKTHFGVTVAFGQRDNASSITTIGTGAASKIDKSTAGRAIFLDGGLDILEVQCPYITSDQIDKTVAAVVERDRKPPDRISRIKASDVFHNRSDFWSAYEQCKDLDGLLTIDEYIGMVM